MNLQLNHLLALHHIWENRCSLLKNIVKSHILRFKSIIGKKSIINYKQENFNIDKVTLSLKVNGKVLSQGEGINEKIAKNYALKKACYKLMMEDTRNEINYKFIIQIIVVEFSKI